MLEIKCMFSIDQIYTIFHQSAVHTIECDFGQQGLCLDHAETPHFPPP